jgi:hypothetical protein
METAGDRLSPSLVAANHRHPVRKRRTESLSCLPAEYLSIEHAERVGMSSGYSRPAPSLMGS